MAGLAANPEKAILKSSSQWPLAGAWVIGVFIGIDLLLTGISMIVLAYIARRARSSIDFDTINL